MSINAKVLSVPLDCVVKREVNLPRGNLGSQVKKNCFLVTRPNSCLDMTTGWVLLFWEIHPPSTAAVIGVEHW